MPDNQYLITACQTLIEKGYAKSLSAIAKELGKTAQYFTDLKKGKSHYSREFLELLLERYPVNREFVLLGTGEILHPDPAEEEDKLRTAREILQQAVARSTVMGKVVPLYEAEVVAGMEHAVDMTPPPTVTTIDVGSMLKDSEAAIRVYGNSMVPNYPAGCVIGTRLHTDSFIEPGHVYVIETRGGRYIKRLYYGDDKRTLECVSDNHMVFEDGPRRGKPCYPPFEIPVDEVVRLHKVVGVIKRNIL